VILKGKSAKTKKFMLLLFIVAIQILDGHLKKQLQLKNKLCIILISNKLVDSQQRKKISTVLVINTSQ